MPGSVTVGTFWIHSVEKVDSAFVTYRNLYLKSLWSVQRIRSQELWRFQVWFRHHGKVAYCWVCHSSLKIVALVQVLGIKFKSPSPHISFWFYSSYILCILRSWRLFHILINIKNTINRNLFNLSFYIKVRNYKGVLLLFHFLRTLRG